MVREVAPAETAVVHAPLSALRPDLGNEEDFVAHVNELLRPEGYRLVAVFDGDRAVAVAGFRVGQTRPRPSWGRPLEPVTQPRV